MNVHNSPLVVGRGIIFGIVLVLPPMIMMNVMVPVAPPRSLAVLMRRRRSMMIAVRRPSPPLQLMLHLMMMVRRDVKVALRAVVVTRSVREVIHVAFGLGRGVGGRSLRDFGTVVRLLRNAACAAAVAFVVRRRFGFGLGDLLGRGPPRPCDRGFTIHRDHRLLSNLAPVEYPRRWCRPG